MILLQTKLFVLDETRLKVLYHSLNLLPAFIAICHAIDLHI